MNERIKEFAFQAMSINQKVSDDSFFVEVSKLNEFEKFAELIVAECIELNKQELAFNAFERMLNRYKEHFGVEE